MAKRPRTSKEVTLTVECAWPLCVVSTGLVTYIRCFDFEPLLHCGEHHVRIEQLHRQKHSEEDCVAAA